MVLVYRWRSAHFYLPTCRLDWFGLLLPEGDQIRRTFKNVVPQRVFQGNHLYAERRPGACAEVLRDVVSEAAAICDRGRAAVRPQRGGGGSSDLDLQLLRWHCRYVHGQHHQGMVEALSDGALEIRGPAELPEVPWEEKGLWGPRAADHLANMERCAELLVSTSSYLLWCL